VVRARDIGAGPAGAQRHLERVEHERGAHVLCQLPADDAAAERVDDEGEEQHALPAAQVGDVGDPEAIRALDTEVAPHQIRPPVRPGSGLVVRHGLPRRLAPWMLLVRISRLTRSRPTCTPAPWSAFQVRR
jgi:hypothetical protein